MNIKYCYITTFPLLSGEIGVEGHDAEGRLLFGFRSLNDGFQLWREKARDYTPASFIPVFQAKQPAQLRA